MLAYSEVMGQIFLIQRVERKKYSKPLAADGKIDFIQDHHLGDHGDGDHCKGILQQGRKIGLKSRYIRGKWEFIAKEQGGDQCLENY